MRTYLYNRSHKEAQKHTTLTSDPFVLFVPFCGFKNVRTRTRSPLRIRALTRPLIFQCVTEPLLTSLVASAPVVSNLVGVECCSTSTCDGANDCALLATDQPAK